MPPIQRERLNQLDVARLARVSTATVSRTINNVPTVNPVLARRVLRVIEQVGYYPNTQARALVSGRSRIFGLLVSEISNPFFPEIVQTFTQLGVKHNYEILLTSVERDANGLEIAARRMIERRVDGVAILTFGPDDSLIEILKNGYVPVFSVDIDSPEQLLKTVHVDYQHGIRQAVQHLAAFGHVRIAFVSGPPLLRSAATRKTAFQDCMTEIGLKTSRETFVQGDHTLEGGMKAMRELAAIRNPPSAVVCSNDLTAIGVMRQAFELSLEVPRDLSVVGFDDIHLAQFMVPPLTTVQMSPTEIADTAFRALLECMECEPHRFSRNVKVIKTNLVLRHSTALLSKRRMKNGGT
ncbi:MAG TPA: LacI family DNA-binding transcriptional regulator [Terriglobales bacterium]|jgi:LacI family transcriptional regulator|nr:LacI family DNA-binding transcriptional regulator [Terriglobales bacterium]